MLLRALLALGVFILCLAGSFWLLNQQESAHSGPQPNAEISQHTGGESIFYKTIGQLPQSSKATASSEADALLPAAQYTLEIALVGLEGEAQDMLQKLEAQGVQAYYTPLQNNGRVIYRVRKGVFASQELAAKARLQLAADTKLATKVVRLR